MTLIKDVKKELHLDSDRNGKSYEENILAVEEILNKNVKQNINQIRVGKKKTTVIVDTPSSIYSESYSDQ